MNHKLSLDQTLRLQEGSKIAFAVKRSTKLIVAPSPDRSRWNIRKPGAEGLIAQYGLVKGKWRIWAFKTPPILKKINYSFSKAVAKLDSFRDNRDLTEKEEDLLDWVEGKHPSLTWQEAQDKFGATITTLVGLVDMGLIYHDNEKWQIVEGVFLEPEEDQNVKKE